MAIHEHITDQTTRAVPALSGVAIMGLSPNEFVALVAGIATCIYVVLQAAYLVWKWRREALASKN